MISMKRVMLMLAALMIAMPLMAGNASSWEQISNPIIKPADWQQIVNESPFSLGEAEGFTVPDEGGGYNQLSYSTYPSLDGSTVSVPMAVEFARQHLGLPEMDLAALATFSTTHQAYENLILKKPNGAPLLPFSNAVMDSEQPVNLIIVTPPSQEEQALADENGVSLVMKPVCHDAFIFIVHADNPVNSLTVEQIRGIYSGDITNWAEVGGEDAAIKPYQRNPNSGSQTAMENLVMQGEVMSARSRPFIISFGMSALVSSIGSYRNDPVGIGYTYQFYLTQLVESDAVKAVAVGGIEPTPENVQSGKYPFATSYYGVIRGGEEEQSGGLFLDWMLTEEGQKCIAQAGYIPLNASEGMK